MWFQEHKNVLLPISLWEDVLMLKQIQSRQEGQIRQLPRIEDFLSQILSNAKMPGHGQQRRLHGQENLHKYMLERNDTVAHSQKSSCALGKLILSNTSGLTLREILHAGSDLISSSRVWVTSKVWLPTRGYKVVFARRKRADCMAGRTANFCAASWKDLDGWWRCSAATLLLLQRCLLCESRPLLVLLSCSAAGVVELVVTETDMKFVTSITSSASVKKKLARVKLPRGNAQSVFFPNV